jgi:hypothetical protein
MLTERPRDALLTRVGVGDFSDFIGIEPDLALTTLEDGSGQTFLNAQIDPIDTIKSRLVQEH